MARYIDADEAKSVIKANDWNNPCVPTVVNMILDRIPTADVVEVVRCKDCVYWDGMGCKGRCEAPENGLIRDYTNDDDFCSYGERKQQ